MDDRINTISPARPERITLDFERLRSEGIRRLEEWAPFIWTDFNIHDPGITILESLCYAITDLSYRTHLPFEDLMAIGPDNGKRKLFHPAEEILPCEPVTEKDYRKILIDIPGVKNVWLKKSKENEQALYVQKKTRTISPEFENRIKYLIDNDASEPQNVSGFEKRVKEIIMSNSDYKNILRETFEELLEDQDGFDPKYIDKIYNYTAELEENLKSFYVLIVKHLKTFNKFYLQSRQYCSLAFRQADNEFVRELKTLIPEDFPENDLTKPLYEIIDKTAKDGGVNMDDMARLWQVMDFIAFNYPDAAEKVAKIPNRISCVLGYLFLSYYNENQNPDEFEKIELNGLYSIKLDLHDTEIIPGSAAAKRIIRQARQILHQNRNLCEDFLDISILEAQNICLCLDVETMQGCDEEKIMAEIIFQIQEFLTPTIQFRTLQQLVELGYTGDQIYDGPLLEHGFIIDEELEKGTIPEAIYMSDLYRVILNVDGVVNINELVIKRKGEDEYVRNLTCLDLNGKKPFIDIECSCLHSSRENFRTRIPYKSIAELIRAKQLEIRGQAGKTSDKLQTPNGEYRGDLAEFTSIQMEFPQNYAVGSNSPPPNAPPKRLGEIKQLQAYLTFYDRLMANYLQQLSHVRDLFAVEQNVDAPSYFTDALYDIPGIRELIFQPVQLTEEKLETLSGMEVDEEIILLLKNSGLVDKNFLSFVEWNLAFGKALGEYWTANKDSVRDKITKLIQSEYQEEEWQAFVEDDENYYRKKLQEIVEPDNLQQQRKYEITNHLLARFGECFTSFSLQQFGVSAEASLFEDYRDYLQARADYLYYLPAIQSERAKAYNYKKFIYSKEGWKDSSKTAKTSAERPDVWNTLNVSGLKKRIYHLLNMSIPTTESVFCDPVYRIDLAEDDTANRPRFFIQWVELDDKNQAKNILLTSQESYTPAKSKKHQQKLTEISANADYLSIVDSDTSERSYRVQFSFTEGTEQVVLQSRDLNHTQAEQLQEKLEEMTGMESCKKEGFHIVEHILLRPLVKNDALMEFMYCCRDYKTVCDPYSFWISLVLPGWTRRFKNLSFRKYFEQLVRRETPAHIAICFRWIENEDQRKMYRFEQAFEQWRESKAECEPDACDVSEQARILLEILNRFPCNGYCPQQKEENICECEEEETRGERETDEVRLERNKKNIG